MDEDNNRLVVRDPNNNERSINEPNYDSELYSRRTVVEPPYIYDWETTNISFLQTASDLKRLGIKNNKFFLKLYDKSLQGIDPHGKYISQEMVYKIITECTRNIWYFLREVVRIPDQGGSGIKYQLNRANLALTWCFINHIDNWTCIPRQIGKTQSIIANLNYAFLFGTSSSDMALFNKDKEASVENLERMKRQRELLPKYLQFKDVQITDEEGNKEKEIDNVYKIYNPITKNKVVVKSSARSKEHGNKIGRGNTLPISYMDEAEFMDWIAEIVEAAGPAFLTASKNAERNHAAYCRIFSSTPGDLDTNAGEQANQILSTTYRWTEKFYDIGPEAAREIVRRNSDSRIVYIEYSYQQLGKDEEWFLDVAAVCNNNPYKVRREVLLQRLRSSDNSPFDEEDLMSLQEMLKSLEPIEEHIINEYYKLDIYERLDKNLPYLVGVDVSNGYGQDNSAVTIIHPYTLKIVAEFKSSLISTTNFKKFLYVLVRKFVPKCILCIERNHNGESIISDLRETIIAPNLYFDNSKKIGPTVDAKVSAKGFLEEEAQRRRAFGVWTGRDTRPMMMDLLEMVVKEQKDRLSGKNVVEDIIKLEIKKGKIQASPGAHDDCVMSYLIALFVYYYGKNLGRYGLQKGYKPGMDKTKSVDTNISAYKQVLQAMSPEEAQLYQGAMSHSQDDYYKILDKERTKALKELKDYDEIMGASTTFEDYSANYDNLTDDMFSGTDRNFLDDFDDLNDF